MAYQNIQKDDTVCDHVDKKIRFFEQDEFKSLVICFTCNTKSSRN